MWLFSACILLLKYKPHLWRKICSSWLLAYKIHCWSPPLTHTPSLCYLKEPSSDLWLLSIFWGRESYVLISGYISFLGYPCPLKTSPDCTSKDLLPGKTSSKKSSSWMKSQQGHWLQVTHPSVILHSYMHHTCIQNCVTSNETFLQSS